MEPELQHNLQPRHLSSFKLCRLFELLVKSITANLKMGRAFSRVFEGELIESLLLINIEYNSELHRIIIIESDQGQIEGKESHTESYISNLMHHEAHDIPQLNLICCIHDHDKLRDLLIGEILELTIHSPQPNNITAALLNMKSA